MRARSSEQEALRARSSMLASTLSRFGTLGSERKDCSFMGAAPMCLHQARRCRLYADRQGVVTPRLTDSAPVPGDQKIPGRRHFLYDTESRRGTERYGVSGAQQDSG